MNELTGAGLEAVIKQMNETIRDLSKQIQESQQVSNEEAEILKKYKEGATLLEFILVTGGLINGKILWIGNQSIGVRADTGQEVILYKHAIAFIQEKAER